MNYNKLITKISSKFKSNWKSGLTVAMFSFPLSIAIAVASGTSPLQGVITGIVASTIASIFGGSNYNIIGVTGSITIVLLTFSIQFGAIYFPLISIVAGLFIYLIYLFKLERYLVYIPSSVMYGFSAGVAIQIIFSQINDVLGLILPVEESLFYNLLETFKASNDINYISILLFLVFLALLFLIKKIKPNIPSIIPVTLLGVLLGYIIESNDSFKSLTISLQEKLSSNQSIELISGFNINLIFESLQNYDLLKGIILTGIIIAFISTLETLITAKIADKMTKTRFNSRKEIFALGLANIGSGIFGGFPVAAGYMETGLNIKTGATHRMSQIIDSISTFIISIILFNNFQYISISVLSAILVYIALGLIEFDKFEIYWKDDKKNFIVSIIVAIIVIVFDASIGILVGISLSLLLFVDKLSKGEFVINFNSNKKIIECDYGNCLLFPNQDIDVVVYSIEGILVYLDSEAHLDNFKQISKINTIKTVVIRMRDVFYMDLDGLEILEEIIEILQDSDIEVILTKPSKNVLKRLKNSNLYKELNEKGLVFEKTELALSYLGFSEQEIGNKPDKKEIHLGLNDIL